MLFRSNEGEGNEWHCAHATAASVWPFAGSVVEGFDPHADKKAAAARRHAAGCAEIEALTPKGHLCALQASDRAWGRSDGLTDYMGAQSRSSAGATSILSASAFGMGCADILPCALRLTQTTVSFPRATSVGGSALSLRMRNK